MLEDLGMRRLPPTAGEDLLKVFMRRYEKGAIILTTNGPLEHWAPWVHMSQAPLRAFDLPLPVGI